MSERLKMYLQSRRSKIKHRLQRRRWGSMDGLMGGIYRTVDPVKMVDITPGVLTPVLLRELHEKIVLDGGMAPRVGSLCLVDE